MSARAGRPLLGVVAALAAAAGCATTEVRRSHPQLASANDPEQATVYFLRPAVERSGFTGLFSHAGDPIAVDVGGDELLVLLEGDYVVAHLKPYLGMVALRQWHATQNASSPGTVGVSASTVMHWGGGEFTLFGRETHYLVVHAAAWSAAGLTIEKVERAQAVDLESKLRPVGDAVGEPIRP
jgi:hypothetical protein